jgi:hypothetical protein
VLAGVVGLLALLAVAFALAAPKGSWLKGRSSRTFRATSAR